MICVIDCDDARSSAILAARREHCEKTPVRFLSHHAHLLTRVQKVSGSGMNIGGLQRKKLKDPPRTLN